VPHVGWNTITNLSSALFCGVKEGSYLYYVHSFAANINKNTIAITDYGSSFSASLCRDNFFGCQFHPEKSGEVGEQILKNFIRL
ncbi:MAG: imidazole glycerol phosphate synthase subunit HisH, partial [Rikenellaceae bacterium]